MSRNKLYWWTGQDLNPLPPACKAGALPGELPAHSIFATYYCILLYFKSGDKTHSKNPPIKSVITIIPTNIAIKPASL